MYDGSPLVDYLLYVLDLSDYLLDSSARFWDTLNRDRIRASLG